MAHSKQAKKRILQTERMTTVNRPIKTFTARRVRDAREAIVDGGPEAVEAVRAAQSALDLAAKGGVMHKNAASRRKSRLAKALKAATAA